MYAGCTRGYHRGDGNWRIIMRFEYLFYFDICVLMLEATASLSVNRLTGIVTLVLFAVHRTNGGCTLGFYTRGGNLPQQLVDAGVAPRGCNAAKTRLFQTITGSSAAHGRWRVIPRWTVMERYVIQPHERTRARCIFESGDEFVRARVCVCEKKIRRRKSTWRFCVIPAVTSPSLERFRCGKVRSLVRNDNDVVHVVRWNESESKKERERRRRGAETTSLRSRGKYGASNGGISPRRGRNIKERRVVNSNGQIRALTKWQESHQSFGTLYVSRKTGSCV